MPSTKGNLPLALPFTKALLNIKTVIDKNWHILSFNKNLRNVFDETPFVAYRRNINLHQLIGGNRILENKAVRKNIKQSKQSGQCSLCLSRLDSLRCKQVTKTKTFQSYRTKENLQIFHNLTAKVKT